MNMRKAIPALAASIILFTVPALLSQNAAGQAPAETGKEAAKKHFKVGTVLYNDGNYEGALVEFRASYAAKKNIKVCTYVSLALQALSRYTEAEEELLKCLEECADKVTPAVKQEIETALIQIGTVIGSVKVTCDVEGASVFFNGKSAGTTPLGKTVRLNVGHYKLEITMEGYEDYVAEFDLPGGETMNMVVKLVPEPEPEIPEEPVAPAKPEEPSVKPDKEPKKDDSDQMAEAIRLLKKEKLEVEKQQAIKKNPYKKIGHGLFWSGFVVAGVMGCVVTAGVVGTANDYYRGDMKAGELNRKLSSVAVAGYTIGGAMMITGVVMWALIPGYKKKIEKKYEAMSVAAGLNPEGASLNLRGTW